MKYGIQNVKIFKEYIKTLLTVRNICAHGGQLFDFNTPKGIPSIPGLRLDNNERHSFTGVINLISFFLDRISTNRRKELVDQLNSVLTNAFDNQVIKAIIETKMGYKPV